MLGEIQINMDIKIKQFILCYSFILYIFVSILVVHRDSNYMKKIAIGKHHTLRPFSYQNKTMCKSNETNINLLLFNIPASFIHGRATW